MAILGTEGFDAYNGVGTTTGLGLRWTIFNTISVVAGRYGGQGIRAHESGSNTGGRCVRNFPTALGPNISLGFAIKIDELPTSASWPNDFISLLDGASTQIALRLNSSGLVSFVVGSTVVFTTATQPFTVGIWFYLTLQAFIHDSTGTLVVKLNGSDICNLSSIDTKATSNDTCSGIEFTASRSGVRGFGDYTIDDMYWCDSLTIPGEQKIETLRPSADTAQKDWVPSSGALNYAMINSTLLQTVNYVQSSTPSEEDRYDFDNLSSTPSSISAVVLNCFNQKTDAGTKTMKLSIDDGVGVSYGAEYPLSGWELSPQRVMETRPSAGGSWSAATVNSMKPGMVEYS